MNDILRPLTADGYIGYDQFGQLVAKKVDGDSIITYFVKNPLEKICPICNRGWDLTHTSIKDQHYWHDREQLAHESCYKRYLTLREWERIFYAVCNCHLAFPDGLKEAKNQYGAAWNLPWYEFTWKDAPTFTILIGRRKRVFHMEIKAGPGYPGVPDLNYKMAEECFSDEEVTKDFGPARVMVHAWTEKKLQDYLKRFVRILGLEKPAEKVAK